MSWSTKQIGQFTHVVAKGTTPTRKQGFTDSGVNYIKAEVFHHIFRAYPTLPSPFYDSDVA